MLSTSVVQCTVGHSAHGQMSDRSFSPNTSKGATAKYGGRFSQNGQQGAKRYQAWTVNTPTQTHAVEWHLKTDWRMEWDILYRSTSQKRNISCTSRQPKLEPKYKLLWGLVLKRLRRLTFLWETTYDTKPIFIQTEWLDKRGGQSFTSGWFLWLRRFGCGGERLYRAAEILLRQYFACGIRNWERRVIWVGSSTLLCYLIVTEIQISIERSSGGEGSGQNDGLPLLQTRGAPLPPVTWAKGSHKRLIWRKSPSSSEASSLHFHSPS